MGKMKPQAVVTKEAYHELMGKYTRALTAIEVATDAFICVYGCLDSDPSPCDQCKAKRKIDAIMNEGAGDAS